MCRDPACHVTRHIAGAVVVFVLGTASAHAGPCAADIAQFESHVRDAGMKPGAGPTGLQTIDAQLRRQPTPDSVRRAEQQAQARFEESLAQAKAFDAQGLPAECAQALDRARLMFSTP